MEHLIAYTGNLVSLAVLQPEYGAEYLPWPNKRTDVRGTLQRPPYYPKDFEEWVERVRNDKGKNEVFAVLVNGETPSQYTFIGLMGVHDIKWPHGVATTGSIFGGESARGKGYGTEAKLLIQYHAFMVLGIRKLKSGAKAYNGNSIGHLLKCGYQIWGRSKEDIWDEGRFVDEIHLQCFRSDWESIWETYQKTKALPKLTPTQKQEVEKITNSSQ